MLDPWIGFLNEELATRQQDQRPLGRQHLRRQVLDRVACNFPFPLEVSFKGLVVGREVIDGQHYLVVAPTSLAPRAFEILGGVLLPTDRQLYPGAVVDVSCALADPDTYQRDAGMLAIDAWIDAIVPVEP